MSSSAKRNQQLHFRESAPHVVSTQYTSISALRGSPLADLADFQTCTLVRMQVCRWCPSISASEAEHSREMCDKGSLLSLWKPTGRAWRSALRKGIGLPRIDGGMCRCPGKMSGLIVHRFCQWSAPMHTSSSLRHSATAGGGDVSGPLSGSCKLVSSRRLSVA